MSRPSPVLPTALPLPIFRLLAKKRVVLASSSPRRKEILEKSGFSPEIIPSNFEENLPKSAYAHNLADYPMATAAEKAIEVYERLIHLDDTDPADLVISADTVVIFPPEKECEDGGAHKGETPEILEKPINKTEQIRSLLSMSGKSCEIVTGVTIAYPVLEAPGYKLQSISCSSIAHFYDNSRETIEAYVANGEGIDRAGGFAIQGLGGLLIERIEGNYDNCVGFPMSQFWRWMSDLAEDGAFDDMP